MLCDEPLRLALRNRHVEVAKILLEAGANPNKRYFFGSEINLVSPLDLECMELLLAFGAHPNTRDRAGLTPLMKAARLPQVNRLARRTTCFSRSQFLNSYFKDTEESLSKDVSAFLKSSAERFF